MKIQITGVAPTPQLTLEDVPLGRFARVTFENGVESIALRLPHHFLLVEKGMETPYVQSASALADTPAELLPEDFTLTLGGK